jgi:hypothetical protein
MWSALLPLVLLATGAESQEGEKSGALTPLQVQVVFARYRGDKKVSSMPYTMIVQANERVRDGSLRSTFVRMGVQVPITTMVKESPTITYKDVGTNLDCTAESVGDGRFKLNFSLEQGSLSASEAERKVGGMVTGAGAETAMASGNPVLRNFRSVASMILRDGQSAQYVAATDPVSGEVLNIDVSLKVVK